MFDWSENTAISWIELFFEGDCTILGAGAQGRGFWGGLQILMPHTVEYKIRYNASAFCKLFRFIVFMISWGVLAIQMKLF